MADFEISPEDLSSSKSISEKIGSNFYPNGNVVIKNTTLSRVPLKDRSLRSADPVRILQGDGVYRNPALATAAYAQNTQSALHGILVSRADIGDIKVPDPNDPTGKTMLTGAEARNEILKTVGVPTDKTDKTPVLRLSSVLAVPVPAVSENQEADANTIEPTIEAFSEPPGYEGTGWRLAGAAGLSEPTLVRFRAASQALNAAPENNLKIQENAT